MRHAAPQNSLNSAEYSNKNIFVLNSDQPSSTATWKRARVQFISCANTLFDRSNWKTNGIRETWSFRLWTDGLLVN